MDLATFWFILIAVLWTGYLFLEGFDFGVGMLLPVIGRTNIQRRVAVTTLGPLWDGNEVWLIVAGGATFAAFPEWYATLFSGFYLPLLLVLVALIVRGVAFEYRGQRDSERWRAGWDAAIVFGSLVPALIWGVAFANLLRGVPIDEDAQYTGGFFNLLNPYALLGGLTLVFLFALHGAVFLALKTSGEVRDRSLLVARQVALPALSVVATYVIWTQLTYGKTWTWAVAAVGALALLGAVVSVFAAREGRAFVGTGVTIAAAVVLIFGSLYPEVMRSSTDSAYSLNIGNASSTPYTLTVMTWVAVVMTPVVLLYQGWTYWVFRQRIGVGHIPAAPPAESIESSAVPKGGA